ncbi:MAG: hypothetical protein LBT02_02165 [Rickettsiales bacterium]|jgi:hypothetical protein|nr:hypothetical protein [Rickettsiales bacterium]
MFKKVNDFFSKFKGESLNLYDKAKEFIKETKIKWDNLYQTNMETGMEHFKSGHLYDARFRFWFIQKFLSKESEPLYYYGYCLILSNEIEKGKFVLEKIFSQYPMAENLLKRVNNDETKNIIEEYNSVFGNK